MGLWILVAALIGFLSSPSLFGQVAPKESDAIRPATPDFSKPDAAKRMFAPILKKLKKELEEEAERVGALALPWTRPDHERGKALILLAIKAGLLVPLERASAADWVIAHGLIGVGLLECEEKDRLSYRNLFVSLASPRKAKLETSYEAGYFLTDSLMGPGGGAKAHSGKSLIRRRESLLAALALHLKERYIYDAAGNFGRNYSSENRESNTLMLENLKIGLKLNKELKALGYIDRTLRDALGIVYASLKHDHHRTASTNRYALGRPLKIYIDSLEATLNYLKKQPVDHSADILERLELEMDIRGLTVRDGFDFVIDESRSKFGEPKFKEPENLRRWLQIVAKDLDDIRQKKER